VRGERHDALAEAREVLTPVRTQRGGRDHEDALVLVERGTNQRQRNERFAQPHGVGEDGAAASMESGVQSARGVLLVLCESQRFGVRGG
jgi:hypothetical protein